MRRWLFGGVATAAAVLTAGFAVAVSPPPPPADPIGDVIAQPTPPPPTEPQTSTDATLPPEEVAVAPEVMEDAGLTTEDAEGEEEEEEGRPLPPLADALPRVRQQVAIIQALDKITAETIRFAVPVGQSRRWRGVAFRARACETSAADEPMRDSVAYLEVRSQPRVGEVQAASRQIYQGWMFASAPGLSPLEHPLYDVWVIACQASMPAS